MPTTVRAATRWSVSGVSGASCATQQGTVLRLVGGGGDSVKDVPGEWHLFAVTSPSGVSGGLGAVPGSRKHKAAVILLGWRTA